MAPSKPATGSIKSSGGGVTALRDLLSSVAHQVESHLHPNASSGAGRHHDDSNCDGQDRGQPAAGRRRSRIRSWIGGHPDKKDRDRDRDGDSNSLDGADNSLHFTDASDDDIQDHDYTTGSTKSIGSRKDSNHQNNSEIRSISSNAGHAYEGRPTLNHAAAENATTAPHKMQILPPEGAAREDEMVELLIGVMGDSLDREVARRILRKYDGNVEKAAGALLEGERGDELLVDTDAAAATPATAPVQIQSQGWPPVGTSNASSWSMGDSTAGTAGLTQTSSQSRLDTTAFSAGRPNTPVIDLTLEDDPDLQRAMQESMNTLHSSSQSQMQTYAQSSQTQGQSQNKQSRPEGPVFGPSQRSPDPNWAVVPSQQNESTDANYQHNLNRAIEASLETMGDSDALEPFPVEQQLRRDGCPVVLRPSLHTMVYAASILQGLFYVPQVRERMACWRPPVPMNVAEALAPPTSGPDFTLWALSEIFTHMDLARLCDLNVDKRLPAFNIDPWDRLTQPPGELSRKFFARLSATLERSFLEQFALAGQPLPKSRLLHFQYGSNVEEPGELLQETSIVPIDVNGGESNDLIGRLSAQLAKPQLEPGKQCVIFEPSEVVVFELVRSTSTASTTTSGNGSDRKPFTYPTSIYLDQFLRENVGLAQAKREQRHMMFDEVQQLVLHKKTLTHFDGKDTLQDLRSTIFYFEHVADAEGDIERGTSIQATTRKLKNILNTIEEGIKAADEKIETLRTQAETILDCEELQQFKYDLRVVFVHDGLYGRKHLYSYVHDKNCWWKIADSLIEKVSEELVLNDQVGLHLGAGPYLLFYSRAVPEGDEPAPALPWMDDIKDDVKTANREFLSQLPPELVRGIVIDGDDGASSLGVAPSNGTKNGAWDRMDLS